MELQKRSQRCIIARAYVKNTPPSRQPSIFAAASTISNWRSVENAPCITSIKKPYAEQIRNVNRMNRKTGTAFICFESPRREKTISTKNTNRWPSLSKLTMSQMFAGAIYFPGNRERMRMTTATPARAHNVAAAALCLHEFFICRAGKQGGYFALVFHFDFNHPSFAVRILIHRFWR